MTKKEQPSRKKRERNKTEWACHNPQMTAGGERGRVEVKYSKHPNSMGEGRKREESGGVRPYTNVHPETPTQ